MVFLVLVVFPYFRYSPYKIATGKRKDLESRKHLETKWILNDCGVFRLGGLSVFLVFPIGKIQLETPGNSEAGIRYSTKIKDNCE